MFLEGYSLREAFYMTIITLSTVGFSEVKPLSPTGQIFTSILIIGNLGIFAYAITTISSFIVYGQLQDLIKHYRMQQKIDALDKHIIVCGYGKFGRQVASELSQKKKSFVIIEHDEKALESLEDTSYFYIKGNATQDETLAVAGISKAHSLLVTFSEEAENVFLVLSARQLNPKLLIISRALNENAERKLIRAGANQVVMPEKIGGFYMTTLIYNPNVGEFLNMLSNMGEDNINFEEIPVNHLKTTYKDTSIGQWDAQFKTGVNIIGIRREDGHYMINPSLSFIPTNRMKLVVLGNAEQINQFKAMMIDDQQV